MSGTHDTDILKSVFDKPPVQFNKDVYTQQRPSDPLFGKRNVPLPPTSAQPTRSSLKQPLASPSVVENNSSDGDIESNNDLSDGEANDRETDYIDKYAEHNAYLEESDYDADKKKRQ